MTHTLRNVCNQSWVTSTAMMTIEGKDLLNMDFRIKPRIFGFIGAGTRFKYTRDESDKEKITAQGPLSQDVELLVSSEMNCYACLQKI